MFKPLIQTVLQHLMQQNQWSAPQLRPYAHQTIALDFKVARAHLTILADGSLAVAADSAVPEATLHLPPSLVMRLLRQEADAHSLVKIEGDAALGMAVGKHLATLRWDVEQDLSLLVGDMAAYEIVQFSQQQFSALQAQGRNLAEMLSEYVQEEHPLVAKKQAISQFNQAVDALREDTDRLHARVDRLMARLAPTESH